MKLMVSCDQVFDVLTRGPFPAGQDSDEAVELHLRACHECRQLAEALQPAVALLHEAMPRDEGTALPAYHGELFARPATNARVRPLPEVIVDYRAEPRTQAARFWSRGAKKLHIAARLVAAGSLIGSLSLLVWSLGLLLHNVQREPFAAAAPAVSAARHRPTAAGIATLAALHLPQVCFPSASSGAGETKAAAVFSPQPRATATHVCCTRCHSEASPNKTAVRSIARLEQSCSACHESGA
jgi:hypothetical protein